MSGTRFVILPILAVIAAISVCSSQCNAQPEHYGFPPKLTDLTWLGSPIEREDLTPVEKTEILVTWLIRERREPSPTTTGLAGGDITSGYIQAQILTALFVEGDTLTISEIASDTHADGDVRDAMRIALGLMGDTTQVPVLIAILDNQREPYFRAKAAEALGHLGATEATTALERALLDEYFVQAGNCMTGVYTEYPVRRAAKEALLKLNNPSEASAARERSQVFTKRLRATSQSYVAFRKFLEQRGWKVTWDANGKVAWAVHDQTQLRVIAGKSHALLSGSKIPLNVLPSIVGARLWVPRSLLARAVYETRPLAQLARLPKAVRS